MKIWFFRILSFFLFLSVANAQTDSLNISWDANSEPDIQRYKLQRSINSLNNFEDFLTLNHPLTHAVDHSVEPGNLYAYRVAAINSAGDMSLYTAPVSVGIPAISWQLSYLKSGENTAIPRASFLSDPDNDVAELQLEITQAEHVSVAVQGGIIVLSPSPLDYTGPASFTIRAEDPHGLLDLKTDITIAIVDSVVNNGGGTNPPSGQELIVYPNPIKTNQGQQEMIFTNLPAETRKIGLYSLAGDPVYEEKLSSQSLPDYRINIVNNIVEFPSGLYIYIIRDEHSRVLGSGKIAVIR